MFHLKAASRDVHRTSVRRWLLTSSTHHHNVRDTVLQFYHAIAVPSLPPFLGGILLVLQVHAPEVLLEESEL